MKPNVKPPPYMITPATFPRRPNRIDASSDTITDAEGTSEGMIVADVDPFPSPNAPETDEASEGEAAALTVVGLGIIMIVAMPEKIQLVGVMEFDDGATYGQNVNV